MRWDFAITEWRNRLVSDTNLMALLPRDDENKVPIYPASSARKVTVPSVDYRIITDTIDENFNDLTLQVDLWAEGIRVAGLIERRIRMLSHKDVYQVLGGERWLLQYEDGRTLDFPSDPGVIHRALDFHFSLLRGYNAA